jgi:prolyl-tRNA editing enzyme YbaK/EbsC (Cys-tRNA(Pro) deacylase)
VLMDPALFRHPLIWAGAGSPKHVLGMAPTELARLSRARPLDVSAD